MRRERLQNDTSSTLDGGIDDSVTAITLVDGTGFPSEGDFRLLIDDEILLGTARSTHDVTVARGQEGTTPASHSNGADVILILTEDSLEQYVRDNLPWHNQAPALRIYDASGNVIGESSFTWVNQETATATDSNGAIVLKAPAGTGADVRAKVLSSPATPYSVIAAFTTFHQGLTEAGGQPRAGLVFREDSTGEIILFSVRHLLNDGSFASGTPAFLIQRFNSATSFNGEVETQRWHLGSELIWLKMEDDGTDLNFFISPNGIDWFEIHSESRTAFMAGGPDQVGFAAQASNATSQVWMLLQHFSFE